MSRQEMREGEFVMAGVQRAVKGQKSYDWGRMNRRMQVRMAGLAEPTCYNYENYCCRLSLCWIVLLTVTRTPRAVTVSNMSPQPGMKCGDLKNQSRIRRMKRSSTWTNQRGA